MQRTLENVTFRGAEVHLKRGARAWRAGWPQGMWVEMCVDNRYRYVIFRDGAYEPWKPDLNDFSSTVWFVRQG